MSEFKQPVDLTPCAPHLIAIHFADESYTPTPGHQKLLCDEMWRRYVNHERLVEALALVVDQWTDGGGCFGSIEQARTLLSSLEAEKGGEL